MCVCVCVGVGVGVCEVCVWVRCVCVCVCGPARVAQALGIFGGKKRKPKTGPDKAAREKKKKILIRRLFLIETAYGLLVANYRSLFSVTRRCTV